MIIYGCDPGVSGGLARMDGRDIELYSFKDHTLQEIVNLFDSLFDSEVEDKFVMLEQLQPLPSFIRGCKASWVLAESYATIKTLLTVHKVPFELVLPQKWQKFMGLVIKKTKKKIDKKKLNREKAQALFPRLGTITLETADALLIATYCKRIKEGNLG